MNKREMGTRKKLANIELVAQLYSAFESKTIPKLLELLSEDVEWGEPENPYNPAAGTKNGHAGFLKWINIGKEAEEILLLELNQFLTGEDSVAVTGFMKCMAKKTGKIYTSDFVHLIHIKANKIIKFQEFFDTYVAGEAFR